PSAASAAQALPVTLKSGEEHGSVDIQLRAVRAVRVSGTLLTPDGPASTTAVRLEPAGNELVLQQLESAATVTDVAGAFTFPAVAPGDYALRVLRLPRAPAVPEDGFRTAISPTLGPITISGGVATTDGPPPPEPTPPDATLYALAPLSVPNRDLDGLV